MADIKIENYSKSIKGTQILSNINLELQGGKIYGFKGINGSGKTMLMRAIAGLILPDEGKVLIDDKELGKDISFPPSIGVLLENPAFLSNYTSRENLKLLASIQKKVSDEEIDAIISKVGLEPSDKRTYRKFSLGMKQRLGVAAAIMGNPDIVILDEPMNALDEAGMECIRQILCELRDSGSLVIIACHDTEELKSVTDKIYTIVAGKITGEV